MNILFIFSTDDVHSFQKPLRTFTQMHFGISSISAVLKQNGHKTDLVIVSKIFGKLNELRIDRAIASFRPEIICFTSVATQYTYVAKIAKYIKNKFPKIFLIIGGPHVSLNPKIAMKESFDCVCIGEGEYPVLEFVNSFTGKNYATDIKNLRIKKQKKWHVNPMRPLISNLDDLPFPDRTMWYKYLDVNPGSQQSILLGRGCPFSCTYCSNHALRKLASGTYVRFRSAQNILKELKQVIREFPEIQDINLEVETIAVNQFWAFDFLKKLADFNKKLKNKFTFTVDLRITPNLDQVRLFKAFKKAKVKNISIGLESGNQEVRKQILRRDYTNEEIINIAKLSHKYGVMIRFYNLLGLPGETPVQFIDTINLNKLCQPSEHSTSIFYPYPGTDLYNLCKDKKYLSHSLDIPIERTSSILNLPGFTKKEIKKFYIFMDFYIYKNILPMPAIIFRTIRNYMNINPYSSLIYKNLNVRLAKVQIRERIRNYMSKYQNEN